MKSLFFLLNYFFICFASCTTVLVPNQAYKELVEKMGGKEVEVQAIVKGGGDLHHYDPTFKQLQSLKNHELWIRLNQPFEQKLQGVVQAESLQLGEEQTDPHFWMSFTHLQKHAVSITKKLSELDPEHKGKYHENLVQFIDELNRIWQKAKAKQQKSNIKAVGASHDALGFLCKDLGVEQIALDHHGSELSIKQLQKIQAELKGKNVKHMIYVHPHGKKSAEKIASTLGLKLIHFDPNQGDVLKNLNQLINEVYGNDS